MQGILRLYDGYPRPKGRVSTLEWTGILTRMDGYLHPERTGIRTRMDGYPHSKGWVSTPERTGIRT